MLYLSATEEKWMSWDREATKGCWVTLGALGDVSGAACVLRSPNISLPDWLEKNFFFLALAKGIISFPNWNHRSRTRGVHLQSTAAVFECCLLCQTIVPWFVELLLHEYPWVLSMSVLFLWKLLLKRCFSLSSGSRKMVSIDFAGYLKKSVVLLSLGNLRHPL